MTRHQTTKMKDTVPVLRDLKIIKASRHTITGTEQYLKMENF